MSKTHLVPWREDEPLPVHHPVLPPQLHQGRLRHLLVPLEGLELLVQPLEGGLGRVQVQPAGGLEVGPPDDDVGHALLQEAQLGGAEPDKVLEIPEIEFLATREH